MSRWYTGVFFWVTFFGGLLPFSQTFWAFSRGRAEIWGILFLLFLDFCSVGPGGIFVSCHSALGREGGLFKPRQATVPLRYLLDRFAPFNGLPPPPPSVDLWDHVSIAFFGQCLRPKTDPKGESLTPHTFFACFLTFFLHQSRQLVDISSIVIIFQCF